jgi:hypothetical protein
MDVSVVIGQAFNIALAYILVDVMILLFLDAYHL